VDGEAFKFKDSSSITMSGLITEKLISRAQQKCAFPTLSDGNFMASMAFVETLK
jgi:hypothetical protein